MKNSEAGSKLRYRLIFAPILVGVMVGIFLLDYYRHEVLALRFVMALVCTVAFHEFAGLCGNRGHRVAIWGGIAALLALPVFWSGIRIPPPIWFLIQWSWARG